MLFRSSGTTLIAAQRASRICRGVEIDPLYVDVALCRYRDLFGVEPILAATRETFAQVQQRRQERES